LRLGANINFKQRSATLTFDDIMTIAVLTNFLPPYRKALYLALSAMVDHCYVLLSTPMESNRSWEVDHEGLDVTIQRSFSFNKKWKYEGGFTEKTPVHIPIDTFSQLRKCKADAVISAELGMRSLLSLLYCKWTGTPLILWLTLSEHTEKNKKGLRLWLRKYLLRSADALLCNGKSSERYVRSLGSNRPVFFVPYTSDYVVKENPKATVHQRRRFLFSGQLIDRKGVKQMVSAFKTWSQQFPDKELSLVIAGDGPERKTVEDLKDCPNIEYTLLGNVAYEKLKEQYEAADIYLFPSLADEWGVVVNEALSCGTPVLGSIYSQAVEELIENGKNGWLFDPFQTESFVEGINKAIDCPEEELKKLSKAALAAIRPVNVTTVAAEIRKAVGQVV
jgi:glycosyltransferase involved in cell wall biosynthesis